VQTLSDGTTITTSYKTSSGRDSQGRTFHESTNSTPDGSEMTHVVVNDPVDHEQLSWSSGPNVSRSVFVTHRQDPGEARKVVNPPAAREPAQARVQLQVTRESLGSKTMVGVVVEGVRRTTVIPAGAQGNDRPITVV